jgi:glyceraldehyde 3-phosphate dehydrogenase
MAKKIAINGFGRIGRLTARRLFQRTDLEVVAVNDLTDNAQLAHLFKYDSCQGIFPGDVTADDKSLFINGKKLAGLSEPDPSKLPWKELGVDLVLECTGRFVKKADAEKHLAAGAKKVILSAPAKGKDVQTIVIGVNHDKIDPKETVYSNASCTTNCFAPLVKIIDENWGIVKGTMCTIHAYTADQNLQDAPHKGDWRRARAAAVNIVPTSTGAAKAVDEVYPGVGSKFFATAMRVPVVSGSLVEFNCIVSKPTDTASINAAFKHAAETSMKGILEYSTSELVSTDIIGNPHSSIFDSKLTNAMGDFVKVISWYDNEAGYSARLAELCGMIAETI